MSKKYSKARVRATNISVGVNPITLTHETAKVEKLKRKKHKKAVKDFVKKMMAE